jgi:23S rRNA (cytosine1962-C5)-methyltransferase
LLIDQLGEMTGCEQIFERSDTDIRRLEGLEPRKGVLRGEVMENPVKIREGELQFWADIISGQKTGFYLDQRENRILIRNLARDRQVLDCFAFSGGFTVAALVGGAEKVTAVDTSSEAIELGRENVSLNQMPAEKVEWIKADVFNLLREFRDRGREFDMLILDPPKFAPTSAHAKRAARGYKDINLLACKLLKPGGLLVTFSCSGGIGEELFQKIIAGAALDADVNAKVIKKLGPGPDHPVALNFPEGAYLKGLVLEISK